MSRVILIDIETAPEGWHDPSAPGSRWGEALAEARRELEKPPPKNYKSDEAIERFRERQKASFEERAMELYARLSLRADACQVVTVCAAAYGQDDKLRAHDPTDERAVLGELRSWMGAQYKKATTGGGGRPWVVAWHGRSFDFPILAHRLAVSGMSRLGGQFWSSLRFGDQRELGCNAGALQLVDAAWLYPRANGDKTRLRDMDTLDMRESDPLGGDGGQVLPALLSDRGRDVLEHCIVDIHRLERVWDVISPLLEARGK